MVVLNLFFSIGLLLACIVPYTSSANLAFVSLAVPVLVAVHLLFVVYWSLKRDFMLLVPLFLLAFGYFALGTFIAFNKQNDAADSKGGGCYHEL